MLWLLELLELLELLGLLEVPELVEVPVVVAAELSLGTACPGKITKDLIYVVLVHG